MKYIDQTDKFKQQGVNAPSTAPAQSGAETSVSSVTNSPIPVGEKNIKDDTYTKLIKSEKFQALSYEDKLAELKKIFPDTDEAVLKTLLAEISSTITSEETKEAETPSGAENVSGEEALVNEYAESLGKNVSFDDVIAAIKAKPKDQLTETEQKILDFFGSGKKMSVEDISKNIGQFADSLDNLIPKEVLQSDAWKQKTPEEKLNLKIDAMLAKMIPGYEKFVDENKANIRKEFTDKIATAINPDWNKLSDSSKALGVQVVALLSEETENSNLTMKQILNMKPEEQKALLTQYTGKFLDKYFLNTDFDVNSEEFKNLSPDKQLDKISEAIIKNMNPKISEEDLTKTKEEWINIIGQTMFKEDWADPSKRQAFKGNLATKLAAMKSFNSTSGDRVSAEEFIKSPAKQVEVMSKYEKANGIKLTESQKVRREIIQSYDKQPVTNADAKKYLENKAKKGKLTEAEQKELDRINNLISDAENAYKSGIARKQELDNKAKSGKLTAEEKQELKELNDFIEKYPENSKKLLNQEVKEPSNELSYDILNRYRTKGSLDEKVQAWMDDYLKSTGRNIEDIPKEELKELLKSIGDYDVSVAVGKLFRLNPTQVLDMMGEVDGLNLISKIDNKEARVRAHGAATHTHGRFIRTSSIMAGARETKNDVKLAKIFSGYAVKGKHAKDNARVLPGAYHEAGAKKEVVAAVSVDILNNKDVATDVKQIWTDSTIKTAPDDATRVFYGKEITNNVKNSPEVLETLAAASKYVQDPAQKSSYTSNVETAAKSYPPEVQEKVRTAVQTGEVSNSSNRSASQADKSYTQDNSQSSTSVKTNDFGSRTDKFPRETVSVNTYDSYASAPEVDNKKAVSAKNVSTPVVKNETTSSKSSAVPASDNRAEEIENRQMTDALQQKKDIAAENIRKYNEEVKTDIEISEEELNEFVDILEQIDNETSNTINEKKIKEFISANNITTIYTTIIDKFGSSIIPTLINVVASSGYSDRIDALAQVIKDGSLLEDLFAKCQSKHLLDRLQPATIKKFIPMMSDLSGIRSDIMYEYIMELVNGNASYDEISKYLSYLPFGMQASVCEIYNKQHNLEANSDKALKPTRGTVLNATQDTVKADNAKDDKNLQSESKALQDKPAPSIKSNEMTAVRNDGVTIKRKESFAGISNNYDDEAYEEVALQTGQTKAQQENILTPGSYEWQVKYNKQQAQPATAFTMAALEEDEEAEIGTFGSNKVGMGQKIKKKYPPQDFRFMA